MKARAFRYERAHALADVFRLQSEADGGAQFLAGGQSLLASLAFRLSEPSLVIDISRVAELKGISLLPTAQVRVGALTTHRELGATRRVRRHVPLLAEAVPLIAHPAIRNRGTIGGSLAYADPAAELPACCVALDARRSSRAAPTDERRIPAAEFFTGLYATALARRRADRRRRVLRVAKPGERRTIIELARRSGDYAMAGIVAKAQVAGGALAEPRLVFFGVGDGAGRRPSGAWRPRWQAARRPRRSRAAQAALDGDLDPPADQHGGPEMKRHLARVLLARALKTPRAPPRRRAQHEHRTSTSPSPSTASASRAASRRAGTWSISCASTSA